MSTVLDLPTKLRSHLSRVEAPVLVQELRVRQRGMKPFVVAGVYVAILSAIAMLVLRFSPTATHAQTAQSMADLGKQLFALLSFVQLAMIALIVPAYSAGAISSEREKGTFDLLALTLLSSGSIVTQKLLAAIAQALMLIIASAPVVAVVFLLGGVSPGEILTAYGLLFATAVLMGALGTLCSCCLRNSKAATFVTFLIAFAFYAGLPIGGAWFVQVARVGMHESAGLFPWMFLGMFVFVGGVCALMVYAPLALLMHNRPTWRGRSFRMSVFGGVYALLLLLMSCPAAMNATVAYSYSQGLFLPLFVNPFAALVYYVDAHGGGSGGYTQANWMIASTLGFSLGAAYLFRYLASARFAGSRRTQ